MGRLPPSGVIIGISIFDIFGFLNFVFCIIFVFIFPPLIIFPRSLMYAVRIILVLRHKSFGLKHKKLCIYYLTQFYNTCIFFRKGTLKLIFLINLIAGILFLNCKSFALVEVFLIARLLSGLAAG